MREEVREVPESDLLDKHDPVDYLDALFRGSNVYFGSNLLQHLPKLENDFNSDTREEAFFYFKNGFVRVTQDGFRLHGYDELDGAIWKDQIIDREFKPVLDDQVLMESDWRRFLNNVMGGNGERVDALWSVLGYLLHGYKDPADAKAIIFLDEAISDVPSGRTGKSLVARSLQQLVPVERIDARNFSFGGQFSFQSVRVEHQVLDFNDASKKFDFEKLFSVITDDMQVERKYQDEVTIPFEDAPKILISTNHVIEGEGSSFEDRVFQIEFAPYYNQDLRPIDEFGDRFFDEWDQMQWRKFDTLMMLFVQKYLKDGLQPYKHKNLKKRKLRQETSPEFAEWILAQTPNEHDKKELYKAFKREKQNGDPRADISQRKFTRWCNRFGRIYTGNKLPERKSGAERFITLPELDDGQGQ